MMILSHAILINVYSLLHLPEFFLAPRWGFLLLMNRADVFWPISRWISRGISRSFAEYEVKTSKFCSFFISLLCEPLLWDATGNKKKITSRRISRMLSDRWGFYPSVLHQKTLTLTSNQARERVFDIGTAWSLKTPSTGWCITKTCCFR